MSITAHITTIPAQDYEKFFSERQVTFGAVPRVGEFVVLEDNTNRAQAFEVKSVIHAANSYPPTTDVELRIKHIGTEIELFDFDN